MNRIILIGIAVLGLVCLSYAHSYVTSPISRSNQAQSTTGCRGPSCLGPCDVPLSRKTRAAISTSRGASITVKWPRNNHAGGFIRFAWAPTAQSDSAAAFDSNVQQINCHEVGGCHPDSASNPNGGDSGPSDGSSRACTTTITVPSDLTDGAWTLQWAWFGGAFELGDYYSCVDYQVSGGAAGSSVAPVFVGGDYSYPGQNKCKYFNTDRLHRCINEPCNNPVYTLGSARSGAAYNVSTASASGSTPSTTGKPAASTTGKANPSTTGKANPSTTGKPAASTTGKANTPSTTGKVTPSTTTTGQSNNSPCTPRSMQCVDSSHYATCGSNSVWGATQTCQSGLVCKKSGSYAYCVRPGEVAAGVNSASSTTYSVALLFVVSVALCYLM